LRISSLITIPNNPTSNGIMIVVGVILLILALAFFR
jgi:hypothetical protein